MEQLVNTEFSTLFWDSEQHCMINTFSSQTEKLSKESYIKLVENNLAFIEQYHPMYYLANACELLVPHTPDIQMYFANVYAPRLIKAGVKRYGIIVSLEFITQLSIEQSVDEVRDTNQDIFEIRYFTTQEEAMQWFQTPKLTPKPQNLTSIL